MNIFKAVRRKKEDCEFELTEAFDYCYLFDLPIGETLEETLTTIKEHKEREVK